LHSLHRVMTQLKSQSERPSMDRVYFLLLVLSFLGFAAELA
jgi:hypothetical protein